MRTTNLPALLTSTLALACVTLRAPAQATPQTQPTTTTTSQPAKADPLSGPKVTEAPKPKTLIKKNMSGELEHLDVPVEEAALQQLDLTQDQREQTHAVILARAKEIDLGVRDSIPLLIRIQGVRENGLTQDRRLALRELDKAVPALRDRDTFRTKLRTIIGVDQAKEFDRLIDEYTRASIADASRRAKAEGRKGNALIMASQESVRSAVLEVQQSYERIVHEGADRLEDAIKTIQPDEQQEKQIRETVRAFAEKTQMKPTPADRAALYRDIVATLTPEQRNRWVKSLYDAAAATTETKAPDAAPATTTPAEPK